MTFMTTVMHVHTLRKGESVSYGGRFTAERDMRIATLGVGYADGFLRAFSQGGEVLINGKPAPVVGRVCMDQCMVDIGDNDVKIGDRAVIFDSMGENIERLAEFADTICYELICLVGKRVQRISDDE
jgi:alanine racemase